MLANFANFAWQLWQFIRRYGEEEQEQVSSFDQTKSSPCHAKDRSSRFFLEPTCIIYRFSALSSCRVAVKLLNKYPKKPDSFLVAVSSIKTKELALHNIRSLRVCWLIRKRSPNRSKVKLNIRIHT